jgi:hypothetical protein
MWDRRQSAAPRRNHSDPVNRSSVLSIEDRQHIPDVRTCSDRRRRSSVESRDAVLAPTRLGAASLMCNRAFDGRVRFAGCAALRSGWSVAVSLRISVAPAYSPRTKSRPAPSRGRAHDSAANRVAQYRSAGGGMTPQPIHGPSIQRRTSHDSFQRIYVRLSAV